MFTPPSAPHHHTNVSSDAINKSSPPTPTLLFGNTASIIPSSSANTFTSVLNASASMDTTTDSDFDVEQAAIKYYTSIRGLNKSFIREVNVALDSDPFIDISSAMESYQKHRRAMQQDFDNATKTKSSPMPTSSTMVPSSSTSGKMGGPSVPVKAAFSMPVPAKSFAGFGVPPSTSVSTADQPVFGGFKPQLSSTPSSSTPSSGFSFASPPTSTSGTLNKQAFGFSGSASSTPSTSSVFGFKDNNDAKPVSLFGSKGFSESNTKSLFGPKDGKDSATNSPFGSSSSSSFLPSSSSSSTTTKTPSAFSGGVFGLPKSVQSDSNGTVSGSLFGSSASKTSGSFSFGAHAPLPTPGESIFGNSKGSLGNPVGFSFGSPTPEPESASSKDSLVLSNPFASAMSKIAERSDKSITKALSPISEGSSAPTVGSAEGGEEDVQKVLGSNPHDEEGEGEEDEETMHTSRLKVYKLKQTDGKSEWGDMGIGEFFFAELLV